MTVAELIQELQKWPGDRPVCINTGEYPYVTLATQVVTYQFAEEPEWHCAVHGFIVESQRRGEFCALCAPWDAYIDLDNPPARLTRQKPEVPEDKRDVVIEGQ